MNKTNSLFITLEGGEGAGKSTLIQGLKVALEKKGKEVLVTREPGGTPLGEKVRELLLSKECAISPYAELALFLASRAQHIKEVIAPALESGKSVLCDRFNDSSIAYQGYARDLGMDHVEKVCSFFSEDLTPHLTFFLDLEPEKGLKRTSTQHDRIESEGIPFHEKIRKGYQNLAKKYPKRIHILDAFKTASEVLSEASQILESYV